GQLLQALPGNVPLAMVVVQHLAPEHQSLLPVLLRESTSMQVTQATEGLAVAPRHIYVIPPNAHMGIRAGELHLVPRPENRTMHMPIDYFFRSLADYAQARAVGVVLSGMASDGSQGLREIKASGGIAIAQEPKSAKYDGMPRAALATGIIDLVLPPAQIASELARLAHEPLAPPDLRLAHEAVEQEYL